jgi:hypothetical protein
MHYKNGRPAKQGDRVINLPSGQSGIIHSTMASAGTCNARLVISTPCDPYITLSDCLHIDDLQAADIPDTSKPT